MSELGELFDPQADVAITEHFRPHWSQAGAIVFITFRLHDSIPREVIRRWESLKQAWLERRGLAGHWTEVVPTLHQKLRQAFAREFNRTRENFLDTCHGSCILRRPELSQIVSDSLLHFDADRYRMGDFIIMPNHVHLLASFATEEGMLAQCDSWLHYTAWQINKRLAQGQALVTRAFRSPRAQPGPVRVFTSIHCRQSVESEAEAARVSVPSVAVRSPQVARPSVAFRSAKVAVPIVAVRSPQAARPSVAFRSAQVARPSVAFRSAKAARPIVAVRSPQVARPSVAFRSAKAAVPIRTSSHRPHGFSTSHGEPPSQSG